MAIRREYIGSGKKFIRYSPEEMADARQTDMLDFLSRKEGFTFIKVGSFFISGAFTNSVLIFPDKSIIVSNAS